MHLGDKSGGGSTMLIIALEHDDAELVSVYYQVTVDDGKLDPQDYHACRSCVCRTHKIVEGRVNDVLVIVDNKVVAYHTDRTMLRPAPIHGTNRPDY
jgi:hypothetical protein